MADEMTLQQKLHQACREATGQVHIFNLGVWLKQTKGLDRWLEYPEDLLSLNDEQAAEALDVLSDFTERPLDKSIVIATLVRESR